MREAEAAFELKWGKLNYKRPMFQIGKLAYFKQKNRYIEDRFRHRMMANLGVMPNYDEFTASGTDPTVVDGPDKWVNHDRWENGHETWLGWFARVGLDITEPMDVRDRMAAVPKWDMDEALFIEAKKRKKLREAEE